MILAQGLTYHDVNSPTKGACVALYTVCGAGHVYASTDETLATIFANWLASNGHTVRTVRKYMPRNADSVLRTL